MTRETVAEGRETPPAFRVEGLVKRYGRVPALAVNGVSFEVRRGEIFGLIGPDGAGKTSIVQILAGVLSASGGEARVDGIDARRDPEKVKTRIGYMPQGIGLNLYDSLTVGENIAFFRDLRRLPGPEYRRNCEQLLAMTRLAPFVDRPAGALSGGMRQKLALICTLLHLPDLLLLDEPTTGVDPVSRRDFWAIIHGLVTDRGVTVLVTTAYMDEAERCDRVALMHRGELIAEGSPEELVAGVEGILLSISGVPVGRLLPIASAWPDARSVAVFGSDIHVLLAGSAAEVRLRLRAAGLGAASVREVPAALEDVFVYRLRAEPRAASSAGVDVTRVVRRLHGAGGGAILMRDLTCRFGAFRAVDGVTLDIRSDEIFGLLGPNGAGKTTLIKMLCGLQAPSAGEASVGGLDLRDSRARGALRARIGYMSQRFSLYRDLTVTANLELYAALYGLSRRETGERVAALLEALELTAEATRVTEALPLGLRQRVALASALLHEPRVLFLDEPTSGVDPVARRQFWAIIHLAARNAGMTVVVSTHYMDEAEHCDRLGLMTQGRLIAAASPAELKQQAQARGGVVLAVRPDRVGAAFAALRPRFAGAALYGRRVQWRSRQPAAEREEARALLRRAGVDAEVSVQDLSMEDAFLDYMEHTGASHG
ncbi:MAG TPA: ATP-binding cassette domain-containing protein [Candidatus Methylomirabilis sp.]|nr:ATP-binding cassette domain-containing protein [Candidatus Methylomirabilis sp.]